MSDNHRRSLTHRLKGERLRESIKKQRLKCDPMRQLQPDFSSPNSIPAFDNVTDFKNKSNISKELAASIKLMVSNISKSFIVGWYGVVSQTNHDFVASCDALIENSMLKFAERCICSLEKHKAGQMIANLLHDHIFSASNKEKLDSISNQIDQHEYDICENFVVKLYDLLCNEQLRDVIWASHDDITSVEGNKSSNNPHNLHNMTSALYSLVIALLSESVVMPIVDSISSPMWLYAIIIWFCEREEEAKKNSSFSQCNTKTKKNLAEKDTNPQSPCNGIQLNATSTACPAENFSSQESGRSSYTPTIVTTNLPTTDSENSVDNLSQHLPIHTNRDFTRVNDYPDFTSQSNTLSLGSLSKDRGSRSLDLEEGFDVTSAINFDAPICDSLKRPLENIKICSTEEVKTSSSTYVLYCITYDGLFHYRGSETIFGADQEARTSDLIDNRQSTLNNQDQIDQNQIDEPVSSTFNRKPYRKRITIKRRFREFVLLQLRLEENPKVRPYLKNIPKPTKLKAATQNIFSIPGITNIKLDQSTIKLRQRFLERFLLALNNSPFIANSFEFKEFFSYNIDPATLVNISKSKSLILQVNLNKVFVETLRSALAIIRASLPGDEYQFGSNHDPDAWLVELQRSTLRLHVQTRTSHSKMNLEKLLDSKLIALTINNQSSTRKNSNRVECAIYDDERKYELFTPKDHDADEIISNDDELFYDALSEDIFIGKGPGTKPSSVPIADRLIDIIHYAASGDAQCSRTNLNWISRFLLSRTIGRYVKICLDLAFTVDNAAFCIDGITKSIWPEEDVLPPLDIENGTLEKAADHLARLIEQRYLNFAFLPKSFIHSIISRVMRFYLSQMSSQQRNKYVIYSFFNQLLDELKRTSSRVRL